MPPWDLGGVAPSLDAEVVRTALLGELFRRVDDCTNDGDRAFITRLVRIVGTERLDLPPFPDVARQLDKLLRQPEVPMNKVIKLAERDPSLVKRVWQTACSANFLEPPISFRAAVSRVGFDAVWRIGMSTCMYDAVFRVRGFQEHVDQVRAHGVVAAEVASWLAPDDKGQIYLAGLLHDVGKLLMYRAASVKPPKPPPSMAYVEHATRRYHAAIGVLVARSWKLGDIVTAGAGFHHAPNRVDEVYRDVAQRVRIADIATHTAEHARNGQDCGGLMALLEIEAPRFDAARAIGKAHGLFDQLSLPGVPPEATPKAPSA
jgi:HD-like signal output (HDOD) protein